MGGISLPLLADFHPKGGMASQFGLYLEEKGITDRATVFVDAEGIVRHASSVTPGGQRNIEDLATFVEQFDQAYAKTLPPSRPPQGVAKGARLFIKSSCGFSKAAFLALANCRLQEDIEVCNVNDHPEFLEELKGIGGKDQAPCLLVDGQCMYESKDIVKYMVENSTGIWT